MTNRTLIICTFLSAFASVGFASNTRLENWQFSKGESDHKQWTSVSVPHTWNAVDGQDGGDYYRGPGSYKTNLRTDDLEPNQRTFLRFNAVGTAAEVFLDQQPFGSHLGGYTAFCLEISNQVQEGKNHELRVNADNSWRPDVAPLSGDFTVFGGITRPVELIVKNALCISPLDHASPGVFITQENVSKTNADLRVKVLVDNGKETRCSGVVGLTLRDHEGNAVARNESPFSIIPGETKPIEQVLRLTQPHLWHGIKDPYLYTLEVELREGKSVMDQYAKRIGLRFFRVDPKKGFFLNGESYPLRGVNIHYDRKGKGAGLSDADIREDFELIREIGANCLRLAHYPHATLSYELCDEIGILAWAELPLVNQITDDPGFAPNAKQQLREMIRQHYNHCSIFTWSVSNEMYHKKTVDPMALLREINQLAKQEDPSRPTIVAVNYAGRNKLCNFTDLLALNNYPGWYNSRPGDMSSVIKSYHKNGKYRGVAVSEYGAGGSINHQDQRLIRVQPGGAWHPEQWQCYLHEKQYQGIVENPVCWGSFIWAMFDFSSDNRKEGDQLGVNDKGLVTHDRKNRKDVFFFYKANWSSEPMLYLTSKRDTTRNTGKTTVKVYSNLPDVTLTVNGKRMASRRPDTLCRAVWKNIELNEGENQITVSGADKTKVLMDEATWVFDPSQPDPGPAPDVVVQGRYSASDAQATNGPMNAFDHNPETRWASMKKGAWLACELKNSSVVEGIEIDWYKGQERSYRFEVQTSTDGNTWRPAYAGTSRKDEGPEYYSFDQTYDSSHVRIICQGSDTNSWNSIVDVRFK